MTQCVVRVARMFGLMYLSTVPPSIIGSNSENLTVVVNNFISLTCEVTGFPPPDLSWLKNGKPISLNTNALIVPGKKALLLKTPLFFFLCMSALS